jgi:hypothetical protein
VESNHKTYKSPIVKLQSNQIFVFGSNTQGRHGLGAAKFAKDYAGAIYGQAYGLQGQAYAIVTKDLTKRKHPSIDKFEIVRQIELLYICAVENPDKEFLIVYTLKPNLNGYSPNEMAEMFSSSCIPNNIIFEEEFAKLIKR